jgi:hypothetical protein
MNIPWIMQFKNHRPVDYNIEKMCRPNYLKTSNPSIILYLILFYFIKFWALLVLAIHLIKLIDTFEYNTRIYNRKYDEIYGVPNEQKSNTETVN